MTPAQLAELNIKLLAEGMQPVSRSPGLQFLKAGSGKGREGWWNSEKFMEQTKATVYACEIMYPDHQIVFEVDWSCGHNAFAPDALRTEKMNVSFGGKQPKLRSTTVCQSDLGPHQPKLSPGDTQHMVFQADDEAPFYAPTTPAVDETDADGKVVQEGYVGKAKGLKQVLWERGWWTDRCECCDRPLIGTAKRAEDACRAMDNMLGRCQDFAAETSEFDKLLRGRGHIPLFSPKYHPEIAGCGIEYSWGKSKYEFRRRPDAKSDFHRVVKECLGPEVLSLQRVRKFARRSRQYMRVYHLMATEQPDGARAKSDIEERLMVRGVRATLPASSWMWPCLT